MRAIIMPPGSSHIRILEETELPAPNQIGEIPPPELTGSLNQIVELTESNKNSIEAAKRGWDTLVYR